MPHQIAGLDLSLRATGLALPDGTLATITPTSQGDNRFPEISDTLITNLYSVSAVIIEDLPFGARNPAAGPLGMIHGVVRSDLIRASLNYVLVPPATLKVYATGRGTASKSDMRMSLYKRLGLDISDDNQVDAAWLRQIGLDIIGESDLDLPTSHRRALDRFLKERITR